MDEKKINEESEQEVECSESSRREFVSKLIATAGAVALTGLLAGSENADAAGTAGSVEALKISNYKEWQMGKFYALKMQNGFRISMSGRELGNAIRQAGLLAEGANLDNATITLEFTA